MDDNQSILIFALSKGSYSYISTHGYLQLYQYNYTMCKQELVCFLWNNNAIQLTTQSLYSFPESTLIVWIAVIPLVMVSLLSKEKSLTMGERHHVNMKVYI